jgi:hypothetical protein
MNARPSLPGEINYEPIDRYTVPHAAAGVVLGAARLPLWAVALVAVGWELVERPLKDAHPSLFPRQSQDSLANAAVDALAMVGGWALWRYATRSADARYRIQRLP